LPNNAFGDFQTPPGLVKQVLDRLSALHHVGWERVLEPTCGVGHFIQGFIESSLAANGCEIQGIELQTEHLAHAAGMTMNTPNITVKLRQANLFDINLHTDLAWERQGRLLVIGNPPWVTNSGLGVLDSSNHPQRWNIKGASGMDAMTGASNFDLAEFIWIKLIHELKDEQPTIALLCKTSVARNVLKFAAKKNLPLTAAGVWKIDSKKWFNAAVDACLLVIEVGAKWSLTQIPVYADLTSDSLVSVMGFQDGNFVVDLAGYQAVAKFEGLFQYEWRQGVKHDAASVMELVYGENGFLLNKNGESVDIEKDHVYPLLKGSDLYKYPANAFSKAVIVTHSYIGQDTRPIQRLAPKLWAYLCEHHEVFDRRKSSIYVGKPPFSMFGIGDYTFAPYKVAISGLHKSPRFIALGLEAGRPVVFDDTCYFIALHSAPEACLIAALLNTQHARKFLEMVSFTDAKRPFSKRVLQRINLQALFASCDKNQLLTDAQTHYNGMSGKPLDLLASWHDEIDRLFGTVLEQKRLLG